MSDPERRPDQPRRVVLARFIGTTVECSDWHYGGRGGRKTVLVVGGRIPRVQSAFDGRPFAAMFGG